jgi:hypothetical protein
MGKGDGKTLALLTAAYPREQITTGNLARLFERAVKAAPMAQLSAGLCLGRPARRSRATSAQTRRNQLSLFSRRPGYWCLDLGVSGPELVAHAEVCLIKPGLGHPAIADMEDLDNAVSRPGPQPGARPSSTSPGITAPGYTAPSVTAAPPNSRKPTRSRR